MTKTMTKMLTFVTICEAVQLATKEKETFIHCSLISLITIHYI